jgi:hypothetical protein
MNTEAQELRAEAAKHYADAAESFERSDTDGFVSQWASGIMGRKAELQAKIAEAGGTAEFPALFDLAGQVISTHRAYGQYGAYYVLNDEAAEKFGRRFISASNAQKDGTRRANNAKKGISEGTIRVRAYADTHGHGTGLSGALSVSVITKPVVQDLLDGNYEIVTVEA